MFKEIYNFFFLQELFSDGCVRLEYVSCSLTPCSGTWKRVARFPLELHLGHCQSPSVPRLSNVP